LIFSVSGDKADASRLVAKGKTTPEASVHAQPKSESKPAPRIDSNPTPEPRAESPATVAPESKPEPPAKIAPEPSSQPDPKSLPEQETNLDNLRTYLTKEFPGLPVDGTQGNLDYTFKLMNRHNELAKYPTLKEIKQLLDSTQKARDALRKELPSTDSASELLWALLFRGSPVRNSLGLSPALQDGLTKYASLLEKPQPEASTAPKSPQVAEVPPKNAGPVEIQRIPGHPGPVSRVIFSNDGQRLVIGGEGVICVRELSTGEELLRMQAGKEKIFALALAADGRQLVSCGMDGSIRQWDITTGKQVRLIAMHKDWCRDLAFSKDGKTLISASGGPHGENSLKLWDFASGREVASLGAPRQPVVSLAMLPSGNRFLAGSDGGELVMWDLRTRKELLRFVGHSNNVYRLAVTSDGSLLASASADKTVRLWDVATGRELHRWSDYSDEVEWVAIAPDDRRVLTIDKGSRLRLLDITSHGEICQFQCHGTAAAFSPDGTAVATTGEDGTVQLWRLPPIVPAAQPAKEPTPHPPAAKPSVENRSFLAHTDHVLCIALSPDGRRALSGGKDGMVRLWDVETGKEVRSFGLGSGPVATVCFSGDGREIHAASTSIGDGGRQTSSKRQSWETDTGRVLSSMESIRTSTLAQPLVLALSPAGKHFLSIETVALPGGLQMCKLEFLDFANLTAGPRHLTEVRAGATCVAVAPDGSKVLTGGGSNDAALRLWDLERGSVKAIGGPTTGIVSVALSADLRYAATGGLDKSIRMWDLAKEKEVHRFTGHTGAVTSVAFSPDGSRVLSGSQDKTVRLWGVQNGKELARFEGHTDAVQSVVFSPDGKRALSGSADKSVRFWQLPN
jgi:WD40 repeat protein